MTALDGKSAIVTGASSGIGAAIVAALRSEGVRVVGGSRRADLIDADIGLELDVTDAASCERFVTEAVTALEGGLDVLVNGAGLALGRDPFDDSTEDDERMVLETNVNGLIRMTRLCLPHLRDGHIVNLGSIAGRRPTRTRRCTWPRSSPCAGSRTHCARTCSAGRSGSRRWIPVSSRRTSRACGSAATKNRRAVYEGVEAMQPDDIADCVLFALTRPPHVNVDELVVKALAQSSGGRILRS